MTTTTTATSGIHAQSATSVLDDVHSFYFGGALPWFHDTTLAADGTSLTVTLDDPDADEGTVKTYTLTAAQITQAFDTARAQGRCLCCADDIATEQLGYGCVQDLDTILQTAAYGEPIFG